MHIDTVNKPKMNRPEHEVWPYTLMVQRKCNGGLSFSTGARRHLNAINVNSSAMHDDVLGPLHGARPVTVKEKGVHSQAMAN
jgi:hypothetical protein